MLNPLIIFFRNEIDLTLSGKKKKKLHLELY